MLPWAFCVIGDPSCANQLQKVHVGCTRLKFPTECAGGQHGWEVGRACREDGPVCA